MQAGHTERLDGRAETLRRNRKMKNSVPAQLTFLFEMSNARSKLHIIFTRTFADSLIENSRFTPRLDLLEIFADGFLDRKMYVLAKRVVILRLVASDTKDDRLLGHIPRFRHFIQSGKDFPVREITRRA